MSYYKLDEHYYQYIEHVNYNEIEKHLEEVKKLLNKREHIEKLKNTK